MKAKFVGDPTLPKGSEHVPDVFEAYGVVFEKGKFVDVPDDVAHKFAGNNHYETRGEEVPAAA